jgi:gamma-glutamylcyclotransferase (GGCT)/AIG2-like uncharacterized protein YtfP
MIMDQTSPQNPPGPHLENFIPQPSAAMIPPPPPLPPRPPIQAYKPPSSIGLTPPIPPLHLGVLKIVDCLESQESANAIESNRPFQPCLMFFYGSLMDPEVVQAVLNLPELPSTKPATIFGFRIKMWGIYPALIPSTSGQVAGFVWEVDSEEHFERLAAYETAAYTWIECVPFVKTVAPSAGLAMPIAMSLKTVVLILNATRNTSSLPSRGDACLRRQQDIGTVDAACFHLPHENITQHVT